MTDLREMTTGEAAAWRAGFEAAREAAAQFLLAKRTQHGTRYDGALTAEAAAIRAMEPPR